MSRADDPRYATEANRGFLTRSPFPRCAGAIPESIGNLTSLQKLDLRSNKLGGSITDDIAAFMKLTKLFLEGMNLKGTFVV